MTTDNAVRRALAALAEADAARHASPRVRQAVLDAFDRERARTRVRSPIAPWPAFAAVVVVASLTVVTYRIVGDRADVNLPRPEPSESVVSEREHTVHVRVPRSSLPLLGVPIIEPDAEGTVNLELVLSEDGQARTFRIVQ
jgi:hypothetical protein